MRNTCSILLIQLILLCVFTGCDKNLRNPQNGNKEEFDPSSRLVEKVVYYSGPDFDDNTGYVYDGKECRYNRTFTYTDFGVSRYYKIVEKYE